MIYPLSSRSEKPESLSGNKQEKGEKARKIRGKMLVFILATADASKFFLSLDL